jgi:gamma-glutamyl:cysteine ligase YbdK (ATP-grasp superfamily)
MNVEIMKMIIVHKISKKIDEVIEEMSTNEFKEMILDDYFDFTKDNLDNVDVELNEIISEISNLRDYILLGDYRI